MGELQSHPIAKEDRMFELLKSANLAYDTFLQRRDDLHQLFPILGF